LDVDLGGAAGLEAQGAVGGIVGPDPWAPKQTINMNNHHHHHHSSSATAADPWSTSSSNITSPQDPWNPNSSGGSSGGAGAIIGKF
jgi:hypothetical protein